MEDDVVTARIQSSEKGGATTLHGLIEQQVARAPGAEAVRYGAESLSYAALNRRANQCAHALRELGVGPDVPVAVVMERSVEMVVALLAILKAGGAYLPLNPRDPKERLQFVLEQAGVAAVLTRSADVGALSGVDVTCVALDTERAWLETQPESNPAAGVGAGDLAYIIYTSGSTGKPKGCMIEHRAICNRLVWMRDEYGVTPGDRVLQKTPYTFDVSVWEFFLPLLSGACLVVAKPGGHQDNRYLAELIRSEGVTLCHFVPSMLRFFLREPGVERCGTLRHVFVSGEALPAELMREFLARMPAPLQNLYGPTEAAVDVTYWRCRERADGKVPIGRAIANVQCRVLDERRNEVPAGAEGELYIGGVGVGRGYLNQPELTRERFVPDPFAGDPAARMYRTGDKARVLPDGEIEFLGRIDFQVKVRGFRIELGEIEETLRQHEAIDDAAVVVLNAESEDPKLAAYLVTKGRALPGKEVRAWVKSKLPEYMVPNVVTVVDALPTSGHGKLDRAALARLASGAGGEADEADEAKAIRMERAGRDAANGAADVGERARVAKVEADVAGELRRYFARVLAVAAVKDGDDLFDLGATSFTMVQAVGHIQATRGVVVPAEVFLDNPTIAGIARHVAAQGGRIADNVARERERGRGSLSEVAATDTTTEAVVTLPPVDFGAGTHGTAARRSESGAPVTLKAMGRLLSVLRRREGREGPSYLYSSAGGLRAVQAYVHVSAGGVEGIEAGFYYYQPHEHRLYAVGENDAAKTMYRGAFAVLLVAEMRAIQPIYREAAPSLVAVEAGYVAQALLEREAEMEAGVGVRSVVGLADGWVRAGCGLEEGQVFLQGLAAGEGVAEGASGALAEFLESAAGDGEGFPSAEENERLHREARHLRRCPADVRWVALEAWEPVGAYYRLRAAKRVYRERPIARERFGQFLALVAARARDGGAQLDGPATSAYPVRLYVYLKRDAVEGIAEGLYRYEMAAHRLVLVAQRLSAELKACCTPFNRRHVQEAKFCGFLVSEVAAIEARFGAESLYRCHVEAGHLGQLLLNRQAEFGLGICPIGGLRFEKIRGDLGIGERDAFLHGFVGGDVEVTEEIPWTTLRGERGERVGAARKIAIVGMSGRFPGAADGRELAANLRAGRSGFREVRFGEAARYRETGDAAGAGVGATRHWGGFLEGVDCFDARLFQITPAEARTMDPQERLFLEVAWECLEDAGYTGAALNEAARRVGVFVGAMWDDYQHHDEVARRAGEAGEPISSHTSSIANRVSFFFDFKGPSVAVNTSCSSAMTALHQACQSLIAGECRAAVAGGVNVMSHPYHHGVLTGAEILSTDGVSRPFGSGANGWVAGEGVGAVLLKRLEDAERDGDAIHAVILGTAVSHSGRTGRYGAPTTEWQAESMRAALEQAGVAAAAISYVEAAAPGAGMADAAEAAAIRAVFGGDGEGASADANGARRVWVGSIKANVGHLESASAVSQLAKVVRQMKAREIYPTLGFEPMNPMIAWAGTGLAVPSGVVAWGVRGGIDGAARRRALINAFGATGSAGHVVLEEYVESGRADAGRDAETLVVLSAATIEQVREGARRLGEFLDTPEGAALRLADVGYTLRVGRVAMKERVALVVSSREELCARLADVGRGLKVGLGEAGELRRLAARWVRGEEALGKLAGDAGCRRVSLPTYAFAKERHWVVAGRAASGAMGAGRAGGVELRARLIGYLTDVFAEVTEMRREQVGATARFEDYGITSLMIRRINERLKAELGEVSAALLFEYPTIGDVAEHLLARHGAAVGRKFAAAGGAPVTALERVEAAPSVVRQVEEPERGRKVAIVGVSGRYPRAADVFGFWENLRNGVDCISEVPRERWDVARFADGQDVPSRWGGFIEGVDEFDPFFFRISPKEAEEMDPQERLFLQTVWHLFEDAGYVPSAFGRAMGRRVGVFVGVMYGEYQLFSDWQAPAERRVVVDALRGSIANRISYAFDFQGPSMAVDTLCSSSLTALHLAAQSIQTGDCEAAVVGGVNLSIHPNKYLLHARSAMSASDGRCRSFGAGGDGFVPGEGVGAVLLKPLEAARRDGDQIYGVIDATAVNHDGRTHGYTVPNPNAQADMIAEALRKAGVEPRAISYVEAHGTGTALGDPVEVAGLTKAFFGAGAGVGEKQFCALGSVKSNIGHLEAAAGVAGLTKILLQMRHGLLVPSLHARELNPELRLEETPFFVQQALGEWRRPEGGALDGVRRACLSSFGAGGANAHAIVAEAEDAAEKMREGERDEPARMPRLIVLSAKDEERLAEVVARLHAFTAGEPRCRLVDLAWTLQVGREAMGARVAFLAESWTELHARLGEVLAGKGPGRAGIYRGQVALRTGAEAMIADEDLRGVSKIWIEKGKFGRVLEAWVNGMEIEWAGLYGAERPRRVSLPGYPFAREKYWVPRRDAAESGASAESSAGAAWLHPLVERNVSDLRRVAFASTFSGEEFFLREHRLGGERVLPAAACLEMVRAALALAAGDEAKGKSIRLRHVAWTRRCSFDEGMRTLRVEIEGTEAGEVKFEVCAEREGERVVVSVGSAKVVEAGEGEELRVDLESWRARLAVGEARAAACYEAFRAAGLEHGAAFRALEAVGSDGETVLAKLRLPEVARAEAGRYVLHPALLDAAFQATLALGEADGEVGIPYALEELEVFGALTAETWVRIRRVETAREKLTLELCDGDGRVRARMSGFSTRALAAKRGQAGLGAEFGVYRAVMRAKALEGAGRSWARRVVLTCGFEARLAEVECEAVSFGAGDAAERFEAMAVRVFERVQEMLRAQPRADVLLQVAVRRVDAWLCEGLAGLMRSAQRENPRFFGQVVEVEGEEAAMAACLAAESRSGVEAQVRYRGGERSVSGWEACGDVTPVAAWRKGGVYLVSGGAGGLGMIFAEEILRATGGEASVVLVGRSTLAAENERALRAMAGPRGAVVYRQADVTQRAAVEELVRGVVREHGALHGVVHAAGGLRDGFILRKTPEAFRAVLAPKVRGAVLLDEATRSLALEVFAVFSSTVAVFGNLGQGDYAAANGFLDAFARRRDEQMKAGQRHGRTLAVNWPLWAEGGMKAAAEQRAGALPTARGVRALAEAWAVGAPQVMIEDSRAMREEPKVVERAEVARNAGAREAAVDLGAAVRRYLRELLATTIKAAAERVKDDEPFEAYGIDSVMVMKMTEELEKRFGSLSKTLFFEHQTVRTLADYFVEAHADGVRRNFAAGKTEPVKPRAMAVAAPAVKAKAAEKSAALDVAVIGLAGRYPLADDLGAFWRNLREGRDCITEIPRERWAWREYYDAERARRGAHHSKWGGFINDVDKFDPLFFNIAPNDAASLDPQERLFLETTWAALEDAGCRPEDLRGGGGRYLPAQVGVYAGVMYSEYQLLAHERTLAGNPTAAGSIYASIANRVSFFLDLHGPSVAVDTMCSSSLTCLHLACQDLHAGTTDLAIAGGVNVTIHPNKYLLLSEGQFISTAGHCGSFGEGGDGYIPGEGVGVAILKRLADAVRDGDQIYGVIKGSAVNHGGKTNGFTVPNPNAQHAVVAQALDVAGIDPQRVTYIEAHGTGTKLGDPIEIAGLRRVFKAREADAERCWLGSVKSNIGHGEAAAGIAGLTKVLLQMRHGELVPSLHSAVLNPHLGLEGTPFEVNQTVRVWERPVIDGVARPRVAGISGFGAGGSNAHLVVEELIAEDAAETEAVAEGKREKGDEGEEVAIVLSAKDGARLRERARQLVEFMRAPAQRETRLKDIASTLQVGRQAMEVRAGFVAATREDAMAGLERVARGGEPAVRRGEATGSDGELGGAVARWLAGENVDWRTVQRTGGRRISLPTYPFARDSYWLGAPAAPARVAGAVGREAEWLIVGETWAPRPLASEIDWQACLQRHAGKRVLVVAATAGEAEALATRVRQLEAAAGSGADGGLAVETVTFADVAAWTPLRAPEVVLVAGGGGEGREALRVIFELSQKFMREAWDAAIRLYVAYDGAETEEALEWQALGGFLRSAMVENPRQVWRCVGCFAAEAREVVHHALLREWLADDAAEAGFREVRYQGEERLVHRLEEPEDRGRAGRALFREGATYLVTGGLGPVGALLCRELARRYRARLVILSRGELDDARRGVVRELEGLGARVFYHAVDVGDRAALERTMERVKAEAGPLHGVIHLARLVEDGLVLTKTWESLARVLRAKVDGTRHLDALTAGEPLEFFVLFSSMAAFGMHGASDYGYAAAFQNAFARERARRGAAGRTLAVAWGPWNVDTYQPAQRDARMRDAGFELIGIERAFAWLERAGDAGEAALGAMLVQDGRKVREGLGLVENVKAEVMPKVEGAEVEAAKVGVPEPLAARIAGWELRKQQGQAVGAAEVSEFIGSEEVQQLTDAWVERLHALLTAANGAAPGRNGGGEFAATIAQCLAEIIGVREVDPNKAFTDYGLDSVSGTRFALLIEKRLHVKVPPPAVIDHPTVRRLAAHLAGAPASATGQGLN